MKQEHLSENELQQLALEAPDTNNELAAHVHQCAKCAAAVASYRAMFSAISTMEKPVFDFSIEKQIMAQLPVTSTVKRGFSWAPLVIGTIAAAVLAVPVFVMSNSFKDLFKGIPAIFLYMIVAVTLTIIIFQCSEMLASYRKKMNLLKFY